MKCCNNHGVIKYFEDFDTFCNICGNTLIDAEMPCPKCGRTIYKDDKFCKKCGTNLSEVPNKSEDNA